MYTDKPGSLLSENDLLTVVEKSNAYLRQENDTRGYVEGKSWAHSVAHGADLLVTAITHTAYSSSQSGFFLETVKSCLFNRQVYIYDEDERLRRVIEALLEKGTEEKELMGWVSNVFDQLDAMFEKDGDTLNFFHTRTNVMYFMKTLYFRLEFGREKSKVNGTELNLANHIKDLLRTRNSDTFY